MNALVFAPYAHLATIFGTALEISQEHLNKGDQVALLVCNSRLPVCDFNQSHDFHRCWKCVSKRIEGVSLLSRRVVVRSLCMLQEHDREELRSLKTRFAGIDEIKRFYVDGFDIGWAVLSSVISGTRDPYPDLETHSQFIRDTILSAFTVFRSVQNYLDRHPVDVAYAWNGRLASHRAMLRACQSRGVDCFVHERGRDIHHYAFYKNTTLHDLGYIETRMRERWRHADGLADREAIATKFFMDSSKGVTQQNLSFVRDQSAGLLPKGWDPHKHNIAIFCSSQDEMEGISEEWDNPLYDSQLAAMERITESLSGDSDRLHLYFRVHPCLMGVDNGYTRKLLQLRAPVLTVIGPDDPVCTYTLLKNADVVLTFGSTVGIEAVFWGKPSVSAGQCYYRNLGGTYNPSSHSKLVELLRSNLKPKDREAALMYGYYWDTEGKRFKYVKATVPTRATFNGRDIRGPQWLRYVPRLWRIPGIKSIARGLARAHARRFLLNG